MDFAERLLQWATRGFPELGDTVGFGIGNTVGKVRLIDTLFLTY